jgi:nucleoside-diphosphate-sugar epimerase
MKVVVVGATGHIGSYLVPTLVGAGHQVVAVSRGDRQPYLSHTAWRQVKVVHADRDAEDKAGTFAGKVAAERPDAVIDLICFTPTSAEQLVAALGPVNAYLLHCGTIWVHGPAVEVPVTEEAVRLPFGDYGVQKAAIEEILLGAARHGELRATVLHPGHIVGPGWLPLNPAGNFNAKVFELLASGAELTLPHLGLETVHHVHAEDVAQAFSKALSHPALASGESFHVVSERALTLRGFAEAVYRWFDQPARLSFVPWETWAGGWDKADAEATWEHISRSPSMSIDKAKRILGYRPRYTSLEGVYESLAWLVSNNMVDVGGRQASR